MTAGRVVTENTTCLGCGCSCDDIDVVVEDGRIVEARRACPLGASWFGDGAVSTRIMIDGRDAPLDDAIHAAAALLVGASRPLVYLAPDISCETQREAAGVADLLHAALDTVSSATVLDAVLASQEVGFASATFGEIRNRADVVVFWGVDPAERYPRYASRVAPEPLGLFVEAGRESRTVIGVDVGQDAAPAACDVRIAVANHDEVALLTALRALVSAPPGGAERYAEHRAPVWDRACELAPHLLAARYVALVYDAEPSRTATARRAGGRFAALHSLAQALNERARCATSALRAGGNRLGAEVVLTSQTGYPTAVDFSRGYPRYRPHDASAASLLADGRADAALIVGAAAQLPSDLLARLDVVACAVVGPRASDSPLGSARVVVDTGVAGVHSGGTAIRADDVPLPLRPSLTGAVSAADVVQAIAAAIGPRRRS